jgi:hypothetical protein
MLTIRRPVFLTSPLLRGGLAAWLLSIVLLTPAFGQHVTTRLPPSERQKIEYLISTVAALHDAAFIRNGTAYDATRAAAHLRLKWRMAGGRVKTADQFISRCATGSSVSGIHYAIRFGNGPTLDAATWLRHKLAAYESETAEHPG